MISRIAFATTALMAFYSVRAQSSASTSAMSPVGGALPNCVPLCMQVKFAQAEQLAPACNVNDLFCLCTHSAFVTAYRQCLYDNCASTSESMLGRQTLASICSDAGAALLTYTAVHNEAAASTAIAEVASVLAIPASGNNPIPTASFAQAGAQSYAASNYQAQAAALMSSAEVAYSQNAAMASASLQAEADMLSMSYSEAEVQATQAEAALETQLSGSALSAAEAQVTATLSMMRVAASAKLASDAQAAQASLAGQSNAIYSTPTPTPSNAVNAVSSSGIKLQCSFGLASIALAAFAFL